MTNNKTQTNPKFFQGDPYGRITQIRNNFAIYLVALSLITGIGCSDKQPEKEVSSSSFSSSAEGEWVELIKGDDLSNWVQRGGEAKYRIENGQVIGTTVPDTPNSFLCTKRDYGDFILELEVKVDPTMNSGIQIRSHAYGQDTTVTVKTSEGTKEAVNRPKGRVYGYQVEIDPSDRAWSGGIYDEARRGWLDDLEDQPEARKAFTNGEWNKYRIRAVGDTIRTWVNGVPVANLVDSVDSSGFIALQVHSIEGDDTLQVRWRDIRIKTLE